MEVNARESINNEEDNPLDKRSNKVEPLELREIEYDTCDGTCMLILCIILSPLILPICIICPGLFSLNPNEAAVLTLYGRYVGTVKKAGYHWVNPCCDIKVISLREQNLDGNIICVNDKRGNPIELGIVVVWRVVSPVEATFQVQNYYNYIKIQSDAAVRHLASSFAYDIGEDPNELTLLNGGDSVNRVLLNELTDRLKGTGIYVDQARLNHLRYSSEITTTMLRRQQAEATVAARKCLVEGAVHIVRDSINGLCKDIEFSEIRKAELASNLVIMLCSDTVT